MARFLSPRWPNMRVRHLAKFENGVLDTDDPEVIEAVEKCHGYGYEITRVDESPAVEQPAEEPATEPGEPESLEQPAEERWQGRVRQGRRGSSVQAP